MYAQKALCSGADRPSDSLAPRDVTGVAVEHQTPNELGESVAETARSTLDDGGLQEDLVGGVTQLAVQALAGCDWAGISLVMGDGVTTTASTDELVGEVDAVQYKTLEGPCLQAIRDGVMYLVPSTADDVRFPRWSRRALAAGVSSSLSLPLKTHDAPLGALNLYSSRRDGFGKEDEPLAETLAGQAAICLFNGQIYDRAVRLSEQLQIALETRTMIGQATGILMGRDGLSAEEAFAMLKTASQNSNMKLRAVAQMIVNRHLAALGA